VGGGRGEEGLSVKRDCVEVSLRGADPQCF